MDIQKEREAFEQVFPCSTGTILNEYGHYESLNQQDTMIQNISWIVWQAAKAQATTEIDELNIQLEQAKQDTKRMDFLADKNQLVANVIMPKEIIERNLSSLRDAIDEAMEELLEAALTE